MANALGYVSETKTGFEGALAMMNLSAAIRIEKNAEKAEEAQPDYRIFAGETATEIGGGWMRKAKSSGREYVSLTLADPQIGPRRIPARLDQGEAPALFVIGRDGKSQLVNYRMSGAYYVVDRLFARAALRLGEKRQEVVKIARNDLGGARP